MTSRQTRVVFVGLGGAGQRHARILRALLGNDTRWLGVRRRGSTPVLDASFVPRSGSMSDAYGLDLVPTLPAALDAGVDLAVIATPTALHFDPVAQALSAGCPVLVEKPLTDSREQAEVLAKLASENGTPLFVGFQRRLHPGWLQTTEIIRSGRLGRLVEVTMWARSNVETWHPYEPLEGLYAVRADLGGGAIRTECHELDQLVGLYGTPRRVQCDASQVADPNAVERSAEIELDFADLDCPVRLSISLDSSVPQRGWRFTGDDAGLTWDELTGELEVRSGGDISRHQITGYGNDDLVFAQDRWILSNLGDPAAGTSAIAQAVTTTAVIEAAVRASMTKAPEVLAPSRTA